MKIGIYIKSNNEDLIKSIVNISSTKIGYSTDFGKLSEYDYIVEVSDNGYFNSTVLNDVANKIIDTDTDCYTVPYLIREESNITYLVDNEKSVSCLIKTNLYNGDYKESLKNCRNILPIENDWWFYVC